MTHTRTDRREDRKKSARDRKLDPTEKRCSQRESGLRCTLYSGHVPSSDSESGHCFDTANPQ